MDYSIPIPITSIYETDYEIPRNISLIEIGMGIRIFGIVA